MSFYICLLGFALQLGLAALSLDAQLFDSANPTSDTAIVKGFATAVGFGIFAALVSRVVLILSYEHFFFRRQHRAAHLAERAADAGSVFVLKYSGALTCFVVLGIVGVNALIDGAGAAQPGGMLGLVLVLHAISSTACTIIAIMQTQEKATFEDQREGFMALATAIETFGAPEHTIWFSAAELGREPANEVAASADDKEAA